MSILKTKANFEELQVLDLGDNTLTAHSSCDWELSQSCKV